MGKWRETPPSGLDAQRQLLDQLMGLNRNLDNPDAEVKTFKDERVCKHFLAGLCPHDLFSNTKMDMGLCDKIHEDKLKEEYDEKVAKGRSYGYDEELERTLDDFVNEVDRKIQRSQRRLEEDGEGAVKVNAESGAEIIRLTGEINEAMKEAEKAGEEGDIDVAQELMTKVETLKQQKSETQAKMLRESSAVAMVAPGQNPDASVVGALTSTDVNQKLRVCDVCGAFLSIYDSDSRLADHFGGKLHMGFVQIRAKLKDIRETRVKRREEQEEKRNASGERVETANTVAAVGGGIAAVAEMANPGQTAIVIGGPRTSPIVTGIEGVTVETEIAVIVIVGAAEKGTGEEDRNEA
eukprot:CAMPEP_0117760812 /NCGR_PEP_ID=MMETSP0947-20121206/16870_1 /TAXON_ID=44440 /ORGANISM="Chattonella subsalsa, Strain CCMP2191" /LENGTH=350 /DNA_ID=CAMNT_0005581609 /DNA_START=49 /DNA_END=1102 /DNA_ORIENTATION=-